VCRACDFSAAAGPQSLNGSPPIAVNNYEVDGVEVALLSVRQLHAFRHGRVSVLQARGVPSDLVKEWVGHSSLQTTSRYTHFDHEYKQRAACAVALRMEEKLRDGPLGPRFRVLENSSEAR